MNNELRTALNPNTMSVEELAQRLLQMEARQQELVQALQAQQQRSERAEAGLSEAAAQLQALRVQPPVAATPVPPNLLGGSTVDTRTLGKPQSFAGRRETWREFRFVFEAFASAAHVQMPALFRQAESMGGQRIDVHDLDEPTTALSRQLYYMLVMLTTDDAHRMMANVEQGNGAEAWRRLCWEYEPDVRVRHGAVLHALLRREFGKDVNSDLAVEIETFERDVRRWEEQSGKTLDPDIKVSVLMGGMQNQKVRDHLELNATRLDTYPAVRAEILNFAVAKRTWTHDLGDPMVIGAVKPKGKDGKGKGRGQDGGKTPKAAAAAKADAVGKHKDKNKDNPAAGKECHYCKKLNHLKPDCRKLKADIAAGKVDSKGKPLAGASSSSAGPRSVTEGPIPNQLALPAPPIPVNAAYPTYFQPPQGLPFQMWHPGQGLPVSPPPNQTINAIQPTRTIPTMMSLATPTATETTSEDTWMIH